MHIVVCIKQVPDSAQIRVHPVTNTIMRQGVPAIINPFDVFAIEEALRLKDRFGGRVTVLTMGPPQAEDALRKAIAYGADDVILLTDRAFAGADTLATSFALAQTIRKIGEEHPVDLVFTGKQTIDGDTAQVGPGVARRLGLQLLTYVSAIVRVNGEFCTVCGQTREQSGRHTTGKIAAQGGGAQQQNLRLVLIDQVRHGLGVGLVAIVRENGIGHDIGHIRTIGESAAGSGGKFIAAAAEDDGAQFDLQNIGQLAPFAQ